MNPHHQPDHWHKATPQQLPRPTYVPLLVAFSLLLLGWGLLESWVIALVGGLGLCLCVGGWVYELVLEKVNDHSDERQHDD